MLSGEIEVVCEDPKETMRLVYPGSADSSDTVQVLIKNEDEAAVCVEIWAPALFGAVKSIESLLIFRSGEPNLTGD